jgi:hypothetical protein
MPKTTTQHLTSIMRTAAEHKKATQEVANLLNVMRDYRAKKQELEADKLELSHLLGLQIAEAQLEGVETQVIADALGVKRQYIAQRSDRSRMDAGKRPVRILTPVSDADRQEAVKQMYNGKLTTEEAAEIYKVSPKTTREWLVTEYPELKRKRATKEATS